MKSVFLALLALGISAAQASGQQTFVVKDHMLQEKLKTDAVVELPPFSVTALKGWSFQALVESKPTGSDAMTIDFITTPGDITTSKIYVGVRERASRMTRDERKKSLAALKGHKVKTVNWNGNSWLLDERSEKIGSHTVTEWDAYIVHSGKEYLIISAVPASKKKKYESLVMTIMRSVKFSSQPPAVRSGEEHSQ